MVKPSHTSTSDIQNWFGVVLSDSQPFRSRANWLTGANRLIGPWPMRSLELSLRGPFTPWPSRSLELWLPGAKWPRNFRSLKLSFLVHDIDMRYTWQLMTVDINSLTWFFLLPCTVYRFYIALFTACFQVILYCRTVRHCVISFLWSYFFQNKLWFWFFDLQERKSQAAKVLGNKMARVRNGQGAKGPERILARGKLAREQIDQGPIGQFVPGSELTRERKGLVGC